MWPSVMTHDAVGHLAHDAEVVGDEQQRHAEARLQVFRSFRICAWMVTSSAVVGSSAISRSGSLASAMAIMTRWRWPPESWCGKASSRVLGLGGGRPARSSSSVRARAAARGQALVQDQDLVHLLLDRVQRVQRGHRLLEDHRRCGCRARRSRSRSRGADQLRALEADAAAGMVRGRIGQQLQDRQRGHRLAGAAIRPPAPAVSPRSISKLTSSRRARRRRRRRTRPRGRLTSSRDARSYHRSCAGRRRRARPRR